MMPALEKFANEQSDSYSLSANLALLRMYAIYPEKTIVRTLSQLLVKAIMRLPSTDFATLLHLIPERLQEDQELATLIALMQHLDGARFQSFWLACDACRSVNLSKVPGFVEAIRKHILRAVHSTCQKVRRSTLAEYLRLDATALDELIDSKVASEGWKVSKAGSETIIQLPKTSHNVLKEQASQTTAFRFEQLAPLLASH